MVFELIFESNGGSCSQSEGAAYKMRKNQVPSRDCKNATLKAKVGMESQRSRGQKSRNTEPCRQVSISRIAGREIGMVHKSRQSYCEV